MPRTKKVSFEIREDNSDGETQINMKLSRKLLREIDEWAISEEQSRTEFIKEAVQSMITELEDLQDSALRDAYIRGNVPDEAFMEHFETKKIPDDIKEARKTFLANLAKKLEEDTKEKK